MATKRMRDLIESINIHKITQIRQIGESIVAYRAPNRGMFRALRIIALPLFKLVFRYQRTIDPAIEHVEGPLLIIGNHTNFLDPAFLALALPHQTVNFVAGSALMKKRFARRIMSWMQVIPKLQFVTDTKAVRGMLEIIKQDGRLALFPEARRSLDGAAEPFDPATAKLIKRYKLNVATVRTNGAYLCWPRWSEAWFAPGPVESTARLLLSSKDTERYTAEEINNILIRALDGNDFTWQEQRHRFAKYKTRKPALGLHRLLHCCPDCQEDLVMRSGKRELSCDNCSYTVSVKRDRLFNIPADRKTSSPLYFPSMYDWHRWQRSRTAKSRYEEHKHVSIEGVLEEQVYGEDMKTGLSMLIPSGKQARGVFDMRADLVAFLPADGEDSDLGIEIPYFKEQQVFTNFTYIQLPSNGKLYNFKPDIAQNCIRIVDWIECGPSDIHDEPF